MYTGCSFLLTSFDRFSSPRDFTDLFSGSSGSLKAWETKLPRGVALLEEGLDLIDVVSDIKLFSSCI